MYLYTNVCIHISGSDNVLPDILGQWSVPKTVRHLTSVPQLFSASDE